jgi:lipopolysaccharide transport system permease protein
MFVATPQYTIMALPSLPGSQPASCSEQEGTSFLNLTTFSAESQLKYPKVFFQAMRRDLLASRELAWRLLIRDISAQYRQSFLGILWAFFPPIVTAIGLTLASHAKVLNIGATDLPYPAYVIFSMTLWQTFTEALNGPIQALAQAKPMLAKINFPREALILAKLGEVFFNFGIKLILIVGLFVWFKISIQWTVFLAPIALIHLVILGTGIGMLIAPLAALYQDFSRGLTLILGLWLFITPVVYPVPQGHGLFAQIVHLNPVTPLLVTLRELVTTGIISNPSGFWIVSILGFIVLILAWLFYRLSMPFIVERMSA